VGQVADNLETCLLDHSYVEADRNIRRRERLGLERVRQKPFSIWNKKTTRSSVFARHSHFGRLPRQSEEQADSGLSGPCGTTRGRGIGASEHSSLHKTVSKLFGTGKENGHVVSAQTSQTLARTKKLSSTHSFDSSVPLFTGEMTVTDIDVDAPVVDRFSDLCQDREGVAGVFDTLGRIGSARARSGR
jgi:hypothetical protein